MTDTQEQPQGDANEALTKYIADGWNGESFSDFKQGFFAGHDAALRPYMPPRVDIGVDDIRALGWSVAVHNDYRLNGEPHTFWLFTKDGIAIKGEGRTDAEALKQVREAAGLLPGGGDGWRDISTAPKDTMCYVYSKTYGQHVAVRLDAVSKDGESKGEVWFSGVISEAARVVPDVSHWRPYYYDPAPPHTDQADRYSTGSEQVQIEPIAASAGALTEGE